MNLSHLKDAELLLSTKNLVHQERQVLTQVLSHLREVERRKLFSELKYKSLFEYCIKELKYSEGQAGRRIQAMRLLKEIPDLEEKVQAGVLTLTHLSQAQSYFREKAKHSAVLLEEKTKVLSQLENTTSRETEKILIALGPVLPLPAEKERVLGEGHTEIRFVMDEALKETLTEVRALMGARALHMNYAELIKEMAQLSLVALRERKFGKKRATNWKVSTNSKNTELVIAQLSSQKTDLKIGQTNHQNAELKMGQLNNENTRLGSPLAVELESPIGNSQSVQTEALPTVQKGAFPKAQYRSRPTAPFGAVSAAVKTALEWAYAGRAKALSKSLKYQIWQRDQGRCTRCSSRSELNIDHIHPKGLGGDNSPKNLRLLCFHCNQRRAMKTYGIRDWSPRL